MVRTPSRARRPVRQWPARIAGLVAIMASAAALAFFAAGVPDALAQDLGAAATPATDAPSSAPTTGTIGSSIEKTPGGGAPAAASPDAAAAAGLIGDIDTGGDSIKVVGGVPGAVSSPSASAASAPAASAASAAPPAAEAPPAQAAVTAPAPEVPAAPAEAAAPPAAPAAESASAAPAPAELGPSSVVPGAPAPAAPPSAAAAETASAPVPSEPVAPPSEPAGAPVAASAGAPPAATAASTLPAGAAPKKAAKAKGTEVASNPPDTGAFPGMQFSSGKTPIHITSDTMSLDYKGNSVLFSGHVRAVQASGQLTSDRLRVNYGQGFHDVKEMLADGNVRISQGDRWETSDHALLDQTQHTVVLTGSPVVHDGNDQITGTKITVHLDTGQSVVEHARAIVFPRQSQSADNGTSAGQNP
jgi:lipopolysaccharide transport protein LptA